MRAGILIAKLAKRPERGFNAVSWELLASAHQQVWTWPSRFRGGKCSHTELLIYSPASITRRPCAAQGRGRTDAFSQDWSVTRPAAPCPGCRLGLERLSQLDKSHDLCSARRQGGGIFPLSNSTWCSAFQSRSRRRSSPALLNVSVMDPPATQRWFWKRVSTTADMDRKVLVQNCQWNQGEARAPPCFLRNSEILSMAISSPFGD